jgi:glycosyltransferase involved in cell wall biosynthesis
MRSVLIISPQFAPVNSADSHRVRQMLPYLTENGWSAEIVTVNLNSLEKPILDNQLINTIPSDTVVHYVNAFDYRWTRKIGLGSLSIRSFYHYYKFLAKLLKDNSYDLIFFSTTAFHLLALGPIMKRKFKIPFVIDIQDPWRSDFYLDKPKNERPPKFLLNYYLDKFLEAYSIPKADGIISVSKDYLETFKMRYKRLTKNLLTVPFSATIYDYKDIKKDLNFTKKQGKLSIVYVGRGGFDLGFSVSSFFKAIKKMEANEHLISENIEISFIGTSYAPKGEGHQTIKPIATELGLTSNVVELTDRVGYFEAISIIQNADVLFIPGSTDPAYTASKIYPYILANKPMMACFHENSSVVDILSRCTKTNVITFNSNSSNLEIEEKLFEELKNIIFNLNTQDWNHNAEAMKNYMAPEMTKKISSVFEIAING